MKTMLRPDALLRLLPLLVGAVTHASSRAQVTLIDTPLPRLMHESEAPSERSMRLVHAISGEPVAGADLWAIGEYSFLLPGEFRALAHAAADADGFAHVPVPDAWWMARASGLGPTMKLRHRGPSLPLAPVLDVPIRPLDWLGRSLPGARISFCGGCGHTPDLALATVGANGIAWLRVDPHGSLADIYLHGTPFSFSYSNADWVPGDAPHTIEYERGDALAGTVRLADGNPADGAYVGIDAGHRGPWTQCDPQGKFELFGLSAGDSFIVHHGGRFVECPWPDKLPAELQLPPLDGETHQELSPSPEIAEDDEAELPFAIEIVDREGNAVDTPSLWRQGSRKTQCSGGDNSLPAGSYTVTIEHPAYELVQQPATLAENGERTFRFVLQRLPTVRIAIRGLPSGGRASVVRAEQTLDFEPPPAQPIELPVRGDEPFAVRLTHPATINAHWVQFRGHEALAARELQVVWPAPTRVQATLVGPTGAPVAANVRLLPRTEVLDETHGFDPRSVSDLVAAPNGEVMLTSEHDACASC
ncbi:MAG: hypothetical protein FJ306_03000 [Planctomycetes bacterium]|nr:hypothetical protein [Planctomycetota bacterium]